MSLLSGFRPHDTLSSREIAEPEKPSLRKGLWHWHCIVDENKSHELNHFLKSISSLGSFSSVPRETELRTTQRSESSGCLEPLLLCKTNRNGRPLWFKFSTLLDRIVEKSIAQVGESMNIIYEKTTPKPTQSTCFGLLVAWSTLHLKNVRATTTLLRSCAEWEEQREKSSSGV